MHKSMDRFYVVPIMFLFLYLMVGCALGATPIAEAKEERDALPTVQLEYVAEVHSGAFRRARLVTIGPSDALYILDSKGTFTPYYAVDGRPMTVKELELNLD